MKIGAPYVIAGIIVGGALLYVASRGVAGTAQAISGAAVDAVDGVISGVAFGIGDRLGVPRTDADQCTADIAAGRTWDASLSCPAKRFISYLFN